jgi:RNA polymerase sigma-70 factor, ECF subfamily
VAHEAPVPVRTWMGVSTTDPTGAAAKDLSDAELIADSTERAVSFGIVFDRHVGAIHGYVVRRLGPALAEELTAETFARAFSERSRHDPLHESAAPWLYGIATNLIHTARRAERRRLAAYAKAAAIVRRSTEEADAVDARVDAARVLPKLIRVLAQLVPGDRDAMLLFAWEELTYEEVGIALGIPTGTVASRISRARRRVRAELEAAGDWMGAVT